MTSISLSASRFCPEFLDWFTSLADSNLNLNIYSTYKCNLNILKIHFKNVSKLRVSEWVYRIHKHIAYLVFPCMVLTPPKFSLYSENMYLSNFNIFTIYSCIHFHQRYLHSYISCWKKLGNKLIKRKIFLFKIWSNLGEKEP